VWFSLLACSFRFVSRLVCVQSGSFCNPGACQLSYPLSSSQIRSNLSAGYACWEDGENLGGVVNGSIRITLGWCSRWEDIHRFKQFVTGEIKQIGRQSFVSNQAASPTGPSGVSQTMAPPAAQLSTPTITPFSFQLPSHFLVATSGGTSIAAAGMLSTIGASDVVTPTVAAPSSALATVAAAPLLPYSMPASPYVLSMLTVYPLKSCAGLSVSEWVICSTANGATLFLDREFVLLDAYGVALSQKIIPKLQLIVPSVDMTRKILTLRAPNMQPLSISLVDGVDSGATAVAQVASLCALQVCGQAALGYVYDTPPYAHITEWLTTAVGKYTCLARKSSQLHWPDDPSTTDSDVVRVSAPSTPARLVATPTPTSVYFPSPSPSPSVDSASTASAARPSFANEDDFLLVNASSVREVQRRLHEYVAGHQILTPHANDGQTQQSTRSIQWRFVQMTNTCG
jgi:hypothetical protein